MIRRNGDARSVRAAKPAVGYTYRESSSLERDLIERLPRPTTARGMDDGEPFSSSSTTSPNTLYVLVGLALWVGSVATSVGIIMLALRLVA